MREALIRARDFDLPDWWVVSGALYNTVWNHLTGRTSGYGIKDVDLFYFDDADLSWEAEDAVIRRGHEIFRDIPKPVEIRNQSRVHLWFEGRFGQKREPLRSSRESIEQFASRTHAVGVRLNGTGDLDLFAPYGLEDIFAFRVAPNHILDNRATHEMKAARAKATWPELTVVPW
ncbi:nucleotidyltransferase family protein [Chelativorans sp. AA-79]|uniref:nucleotidyltransferase family protein n=1 Tax=Chelativorans sp. AA-79 TaxID=3028735 RepID=UPI003211E131